MRRDFLQELPTLTFISHFTLTSCPDEDADPVDAALADADAVTTVGLTGALLDACSDGLGA